MRVYKSQYRMLPLRSCPSCRCCLTDIFITFAQVVRSRLQDHHVKYEGVKDVIVKTLRYFQNSSATDIFSANTSICRMEGWRGFYKGMFASLLRVTPANAINLAVYEEIRHLLKPPSAVNTVKLH